MKKRIAAIFSAGFLATLVACSETDVLPPQAAISPGIEGAPLTLAESNNTGAGIIPMRPVATSLAGEGPIMPPEPDIPVIVDDIYLGVPAGNGHLPRHIAVDSRKRRVYTLNYGKAASGNTISVLDLETEEIVALIRLENTPPGDLSSPDPLDLQVDLYRPRLYAVWGDRYAEVTESTLTIIDADTLKVTDIVPGVEAVAPGPDRLYLANDTRLWSVDPVSLAEIDRRDLEPRQFNEPLLLNPRANRLYLGRGRPWSLESFAAGSLLPVGSYSMRDKLMRATVDADGGRLFVLESNGEKIVLRALTADGAPLASPPPIPVTNDLYGDIPLAFDGANLYLAGGDYQDYRLEVFSPPNLEPAARLSLARKPYDLDFDPVSGLLYAAYSSWSSYVLAIDPKDGPVETIYTARTLSDAVVDAEAQRLYVLDEGGRLRVLSLSDYQEFAQVETGFNILEGFRPGYGQLSLDPGRNRLYISGDPVRILDTDVLRMVDQLDGRGQLTPDPTSDRLYLTSPCDCRLEQCNTLILNAETLTGTETIFPVENPLTAPCVVATSLDTQNQLLYAQIYNGVPGSNSGNYYVVLDVASQPEELYTAFDISFGEVALDPPHRRAFAPRYRINRSFIHRFEGQGESITQTKMLVGAYGQLAYDPDHDRLYAVQEDAVQVFDGDLALLAETSMPEGYDLLSFDPQGKYLYLGGPDGDLLVVATAGGAMEPPPPPGPSPDQPVSEQSLTAPDGTLFRTYQQRLYRSEDGGESWDLLGLGLPGRPVGDLVISPDYDKDHTLLAGLWDFGYRGGLYRSSDGGDTWRPTTRGLTDLGVSEIVFSPTYSRDRTIFLTTFDQGLFRSDDGGDTWSPLGHTYTADAYDRGVLSLALSPGFAEDNLIIIGKNHLLLSTDGGESWTDTGIPGGLVGFSPDFLEDGLILNSGHWRSIDRGLTWKPAAVGRQPGKAQKFLFSPHFADDQNVFLLLQADYSSPFKLQRSVDGGQAWDSLLGGLPPGFELVSAIVLPSGELYLTGMDGQTLTAQPETLEWGRPPVDISRLELQALAVGADGTLFAGNGDAGVFKSVDAGHSWDETSFPARTFGALQPIVLAVANEGTLFAAAGTALARSGDDDQTWEHLDGIPVGFEIASLGVSPNFGTDGVVVVGGNYRNRQILLSSNRGETWDTVFDGETLELEYVSDLIAIAFSPDFARDRTLYAWWQDGGLLRSTDGGLNWELVAESEYHGQTLALSPGGDRLYLGALYGHILVSEDGGQSWLDLREQIPDDRIWSTALAFGPDSAIFLGTDRGVYRSLDDGETWTRASAGLPLRSGEEVPEGVRALSFYDGRLYALLTQGGLFVSDDLGQSWRSTLTGQPASPISIPLTPTPGRQTSSAPASPPVVTPADCPTPPDHFADLWAERVAQLGCPVRAYTLHLVEQSFERGWMIWRSDARLIYALPTGQLYTQLDDTWDESQPPYSCPDLFISQTPPTPHRGFGKVWCSQPQIRASLGNATGPERLFDATLQELRTGLIFGTDQGPAYILEGGSLSWWRVE